MSTSETREITFAEAVREALAEEMRRDPSVFIIGEDVAEAGTPFKVLSGLVQEFGTERVIDTPISEPGFTGIAVGAAMTGMADTDRTDGTYVFLVSAVAAIGGFLFGYDLAVVSGAVIFLQKQFSLDAYQVGFAIGSAQIGCIFAPFIAGPISDRWGRKRTLLAAALLFGLAALGTALPRNMTEFNLFRIVAGVAIGLASVVSPMYIAEISPAPIRGRLVSMTTSDTE